MLRFEPLTYKKKSETRSQDWPGDDSGQGKDTNLNGNSLWKTPNGAVSRI
jgi:hypothetical protein